MSSTNICGATFCEEESSLTLDTGETSESTTIQNSVSVLLFNYNAFNTMKIQTTKDTSVVFYGCEQSVDNFDGGTYTYSGGYYYFTPGYYNGLYFIRITITEATVRMRWELTNIGATIRVLCITCDHMAEFVNPGHNAIAALNLIAGETFLNSFDKQPGNVWLRDS